MHFAEGAHDGADAWYLLYKMCKLPGREAEDGEAPLFSLHGTALTYPWLHGAVRDAAHSVGLPHREFGAHSMRIGGATDLVDRHASPLLLQAKGRWGSDIGKVYARMTRKAQLDVSLLMQKRGGGRDLEELFPNFTQQG